jgi:hypothetical protein
MPQCYCFRGRRYFEPSSTRSDWSLTPDHYPRLKSHGGHLTRNNVRLAHRLCNRRDYGWRTKINAMLAKRMSLEEIAEKLNAKKVPTIHDGRLHRFGRHSFPRKLEGNSTLGRAHAGLGPRFHLSVYRSASEEMGGDCRFGGSVATTSGCAAGELCAGERWSHSDLAGR